jgi:hypothetical protein
MVQRSRRGHSPSLEASTGFCAAPETEASPGSTDSKWQLFATLDPLEPALYRADALKSSDRREPEFRRR